MAGMAHAQSFPGFVSSTMSGMAASYYQPANLYVPEGGWNVTWVGVHTSLQTNMFLVGGAKGFDWQYTGKKYGFAELQNHIQLPSFSFAINKKSALGFQVSMNQFLNADFTHTISTDLLTGSTKNSFPKLARKDQQGHLIFNSWYALGISYARLLQHNSKGWLKFGIIGQLLVGNGGIAARTFLIDYDIPDRQVLDVSQFFVSAYLSNNLEHIRHPRWLALTESPAAVGFNSKIGIKWQSKEPAIYHRKGIHLDQVGLALLDLGQLVYQSNHNSFLTFREEGRSVIDLEESFGDIRDWHVLKDTISHYAGLVGINHRWGITMPASLFLEINVKIDQHFALSGAVLHGFRAQNENSLTKNSRVILTPYFYNDKLSIGLPVSFNKYGRGHVGIAINKGPVMVGLDYVEDFFNGATFKNVGIFMVYHWSSLTQEKRRQAIEICR